ncbi:MAG: hypothetical protein CMM73_00365 [Rhodospirillaceae bacterium]|nr:hypothetical protein [Rhodospirillaceae bacterium]
MLVPLVLLPGTLPFADGTTSSCFRKASMRPQDIKYSNLPLGVSLALAEIIFMLVIAGLVKLTASQISIMTALAARYLFCLPLLLAVGFRLHGIGTFRASRPRPLAIRILVGLLGLSFYFAALDHISLAKVTAIGQTATLFVTLLAPFLLAEKIGWRRWTACLIGFAGTVILIEPGASDWNALGVAYAVLATIFGSLVLIMLRRIGQYESPVTSAIWYNGAGAIIFVSYQLIFDLPLPQTSGDMLILVGLGLVASLQQIALSASHRFAPASMLASLRYLSIPVGMGAGVMFFDELITAQFVGGSAIVIVASIFIVYRERVIGSP